MPNATVRANARPLPEATQGLDPTAAPTLSAADHFAFDLWRRHEELMGVMDENCADEFGQIGKEYCAIIHQLDEQIETSVVALAAILIVAIRDGSDEATPGLTRASLRAIRSQLISPIAEDADRILAESSEVRGGRDA